MKHLWYKQVKNPKKKWYCWGVSAKKTMDGTAGFAYYTKTFYGVSTFGQWYLDGKEYSVGLNGHHGEKIEKRVDMSYFYVLDGEVDIFLDVTNGIFKLCVVGMKDDREAVIEGINKSGNDQGWVPNIVFGSTEIEEEARICEIQEELYGEKVDIEWQ